MVTTNDEVRAVLAAEHTEFLLVEAVMRKDDAQLELISNGEGGANQEFGPRGPQNEPGARITAPLGVGGTA